MDLKIPLRKKSSQEKSTTICVATAKLLTAEKLSDIFLLECLNMWGLRI